MTVIKVLIVDDHILFRQGLASLLASEPDIDVCGEAGTRREAIEIAHQLQPDVILMDYGLPDGDGPDATKVILAEIPHCKILFLTVHADDNDLFAAIRSGATGFLLKNEPIKTLLEAVRAVYNDQIVLSTDMTRRILREFSRTDTTSQERPSINSALTTREREVLRLMACNASNQEIAATLFVSENTVKRHVHSILAKLNVPNRREAVRYALEFDLI